MEISNNPERPMWVFNLDEHAILWANDAGRLLWGSDSLEELLLRDFSKGMTKSTKIRLNDYRTRLINEEVIIEQWTFYPKGIPNVVDCKFTYLKWDGDINTMMVEVLNTDNHQINELEHRSIEALRHTTVLISHFSLSGELIFQNPISLNLFGNQNIFNRIKSVDFNKKFLPEILKNGKFEAGLLLDTLEGQKWMLTTGSEVSDPLTGTKIIFLEQKDISAQKFAESELKISEEKLIQASKLASLGEMAAGVGHEINNPATSILLCARKMLKIKSSGKVFKEDVYYLSNKIVKNINRIEHIVSALKKFSRDDSNTDLKIFALEEIITMTLDLCGSRFTTNGIKLEIDDYEKEISIKCQPIPISQIILNLLNNSYDSVEDSKDAWVRVSISTSDSVLEIKVTDSGDKISKSIIDKLFDPFFTSKDIGKGTGLGLSISKSIAKDHGGDLIYNQDSIFNQFILQLKKS